MIIKIYYLTLSQVFPAKHPRKGELTYFKDKVLNAISKYDAYDANQLPRYPHEPKLHTFRGNVPRWKKIFKQIDSGNACLSIRIWNGKPYHSKMTEIACLTKEDGIGLQILKFQSDKDGEYNWWHFTIDGRYCHFDTKADYVPNELAEHDGLKYKDWQDWLRNYDLSEPLAIIHFTQYRY